MMGQSLPETALAFVAAGAIFFVLMGILTGLLVPRHELGRAKAPAPPACQHIPAVDVDIPDGKIVARWCPQCETQLPPMIDPYETPRTP